MTAPDPTPGQAQRVWKLWPCGCPFATRAEVTGHQCPAPSPGTAPDISPDEAATLARIDNTPDAPESLRERLAAELYVTDGGEGLGHPVLARAAHQRYLRLADAALTVLRGPQ